MSSTIDHRPTGTGPDDPTGRFPAVPRFAVPPTAPRPAGPAPVHGARSHAARAHGVAPHAAGPHAARHGAAGPSFPGVPYPPFAAHAPHPVTGPAWPGPSRPTDHPRRGWIVAAVCGAVLLVALLGAAVSANSTMRVPGTVTLHMGNYLPAGSSCEGIGYASWLHSGTPVTIYDAGGSVVGTTSLSTGTATADGSEWSDGYASTCVFPFTLTDVPAGDDFYRVAAGTFSNGVTFTADDLEDDGADLSVGED